MTPTRWFCLALATLGLFTAAVAEACLWDRDTLREEIAGRPAIHLVLIGWVDQYPPRYYERRLERVRTEVERDPTDLSLFDDAAVACDRLGRCDEAIDWMARKRGALDASTERNETHEYRYLANLGTFHAHRWLGAGASRDDLTDLRRARDLIAQAIELNPDAHFGREWIQLELLEWLLDEDPKASRLFTASHPGALMRGDERIDPDRAVDALSGIITLGAAWRSPDVHLALGQALDAAGEAHLAYLAKLRVQELLDDGATWIREDDEKGTRADTLKWLGGMVEHPETYPDYFADARARADRRNAARQAFLLNRLNEGLHPDTHESFWDGYDDPHVIGAPDPGGTERGLTMGVLIGAIVAACVSGFVGLILFRWRRTAGA